MTPNAQKKLRTNFADRQADAAEAKKALLAKFKPKPTVQAESPVDREARRQAELEAVRAQRAAEKETARIAREAAAAAARKVQEEAEAAALAAKRENRKERKAMERATSQAKRAEKFAAFTGRRSTSGPSTYADTLPGYDRGEG
jgi:hypothetical protein